MLHPAKTSLISLLGLVSLLACNHAPVTKNLALMGLREGPGKGEQIGLVSAKSCRFRAFGFGPIPKLSQAMKRLKQNQEIRYMTRVRIERQFQSYVFYDEDCWVIRGIGYR